MELESLCRTCLASDRRLESPGQYESTLRILASESLSCVPVLVRVCWECRAALRRAAAFTARAARSAALLQRAWSQVGIDELSTEALIRQCQSSLVCNHEAAITVSSPSDECKSEHNTCDPPRSDGDHLEAILEIAIKTEPNFDLDDDVPLISHKKSKERKKRKKKEVKIEDVDCSFVDENDLDDNYHEDDVTMDASPEKSLKKKSKHKVEAKSEDRVNKKKKVLPELPPEEERYRTVVVTDEELATWRQRDKEDDRYATFRLPHKCTTCLLSFRWLEQLERHNAKKHDPSLGSYICDVCACRFTRDKHLAAHRALHRTRYECRLCEHATRDKRAIDKHYELQHSEAKYKCAVCGEAFKTLFQQRYHREAAHRPLWKCPHCDKTFRLRGGLYSHMRIHQQLPKVECPICSKVYKNKYALMYHLRVHEESTSFYCRTCDVHLKSKNQLRIHNTTSMKHVTHDQLKFPCEVCGRRFITDKRRQHHFDSVHLNKTEFACTECSKAYANKQSLRSHVHRKHKQTDLPRDKICDICGKGFHNNVLLKNHMRTHTGERPFHCKLCPSTFSYSAALYTHNRLVHLKLKRERPQKKKSDKTWESQPYVYCAPGRDALQ